MLFLTLFRPFEHAATDSAVVQCELEGSRAQFASTSVEAPVPDGTFCLGTYRLLAYTVPCRWIEAIPNVQAQSVGLPSGLTDGTMRRTTTGRLVSTLRCSIPDLQEGLRSWPTE
jgi:hypothetical protein